MCFTKKFTAITHTSYCNIIIHVLSKCYSIFCPYNILNSMPHVYLASVSSGNFLVILYFAKYVTLHKNLSVQVLPKIMEVGTVMDKMMKCVFS